VEAREGKEERKRKRTKLSMERARILSDEEIENSQD
jgi:hypothetical protein